MISVVVDTSALLRIFIPDGPIPKNAEKAFRAAETGNASILVPELILAESAQVLNKKWTDKLLSTQEFDGLLEIILSMPMEILSHRPYIVRATELARIYKTTVYDALFLAIADQYGSILITADQKMKKVARQLELPTKFSN